MTPAPDAPADIVRRFLLALEAGDLDTAMGLLADDAVWINVSLPAVRGRRAIDRACRLAMERLGVGFRVHLEHVAAEGDTVLTDRADAITRGRFEQRFWVYGRFVVRDGRIVVWRDAFDWGDLTVGLLRGLAGLAAPALNRPWPGPAR
ncbi:MAG TPA: limonene-1,2-epoxide hydrolase family protein [Capillimicrobium sp.]|jgi:limonene-1,2-epoxide hydrolase